MAQISENITSSNHKIYSYDQMRKIIVNLGSKNFENKDDLMVAYLTDARLATVTRREVYVS